MSFLYARYAWWRAIVAASRDPKKLVLITVASSAGFGAVAYGIQGMTERVADAKSDEIRREVSRDKEAARYATHSKRALEVILADAVGKDAPDHKYPMKMPQVHWHPGALKRAETPPADDKPPTATKSSAVDTKAPVAAEEAKESK